MLETSNAFWKMICVKEELANYSCISEESPLPENSQKKSELRDLSMESTSSTSTLHGVLSGRRTNDTVTLSSSENTRSGSAHTPPRIAKINKHVKTI